MILNCSILAHFSCPQIRGDCRIASSIAQAATVAAVTPALMYLADRKGPWREIAGILEAWLERPADFAAFWRTSISKFANVSEERGSARFYDFCARLLLDIADQLDDFATPAIRISDAPLVVRGHVIGGLNSVILRKVGSCLEISSPSLDGCYKFRGQRLTRRPHRTHTVKLARDGAIQLIEANQSAADICAESLRWSPLRSESLGQFGRTGRVVEALALLDGVMPEYAEWVRFVVATIIVVPGEETVSCSGSWSDTAGTIYLSEPVSAIEAAEVLVHEASHQHFNVARFLGPVHEGDDTLYYSPPVKKERPLDRILIAYHAFSNVLIFYRSLSQMAGISVNEAQAEKCRAYVEVLEGHLAGSRALTPLGEALFMPLREVVRRSGDHPTPILDDDVLAFPSGARQAVPMALAVLPV